MVWTLTGFADEISPELDVQLDTLAAEGSGGALRHEKEKAMCGDTRGRCLDLLRWSDSPIFRAAWDAGDFVQCGVGRHREGYADLRPYIAYVHVKDSIFDTKQVVPA